MSNETVILYGYDASPFVNKVKKLLLLKKIPYRRVYLEMIPPRPELVALGIPYRRVPVLAVGNDVYCDSALITDVLERRFPPSQGYPSLYPPRIGSENGRADTGLAKVLTTYWANNIVGKMIAFSLDFGKFPPELLADRSKFFGMELDVKAHNDSKGTRASAITSHLGLLEEQLSDGRQYLLDTVRPGLLDIQLYLVLSWVYLSSDKELEGFQDYVRELFNPVLHVKILEWLERMKSYVQALEANEETFVSKISGEEAAKFVFSSSHENAESVIGFDEVEGRRLGVKVGDTVGVAPTDTAFVPTVGRLVALNWQEVVLEVNASEGAGTIRAHFPRLEFAITQA